MRPKPSHLLLPYREFEEWAKGEHSPEIMAWLGSWHLLDLALSPMIDENRQQMRYGHYIGWFDSIGKRP